MVDTLEEASESTEILHAKVMFGKFTLDAIATSGFGIECNSFKEPDNIFRLNAIKLVRYLAYLQIQYSKNKKNF